MLEHFCSREEVKTPESQRVRHAKGIWVQDRVTLHFAMLPTELLSAAIRQKQQTITTNLHSLHGPYHSCKWSACACWQKGGWWFNDS